MIPKQSNNIMTDTKKKKTQKKGEVGKYLVPLLIGKAINQTQHVFRAVSVRF